MGLLAKILERSESRAPTILADTDPTATWPAPAPCPSCLCPAFWIDVYANPPHCRSCDPPSSPSLVKYRAWVIGVPPAYEWVGNPRADGECNREADADDFTCADWTTWPIMHGDGSSAHVTATAIRERVGHARLGRSTITPTGICGGGKLIDVHRYDPPLVCGPMGDLRFDEWFDRLPYPP